MEYLLNSLSVIDIPRFPISLANRSGGGKYSTLSSWINRGTGEWGTIKDIYCVNGKPRLLSFRMIMACTISIHLNNFGAKPNIALAIAKMFTHNDSEESSRKACHLFDEQKITLLIFRGGEDASIVAVNADGLDGDLFYDFSVHSEDLFEDKEPSAAIICLNDIYRNVYDICQSYLGDQDHG
jgi:hypothetical protein